MKHLRQVLLTLFLTMVMVACSDDEGQTDPTQEPEDTEGVENNEEENNGNTEDPDPDEDANEDEENDGSSDSSEDLPENQMDLKLGDTAEIKSNIDHFHITLDSAKAEEEINEQRSQLELFLILDVTVENIGDEPMNLADVVFDIQASDLEEGSGSGDIAPLLGEPEFAGELMPGEKSEGKLIIESYQSENDTYYMSIGRGFEAAGIMNMATWTFPVK